MCDVLGSLTIVNKKYLIVFFFLTKDFPGSVKMGYILVSPMVTCKGVKYAFALME